MNEKLNKINTSITEIRSILGEECASIEQLPSFVKNLADNAARSGFTTAFIFSSKNNPNVPTGGSLDTITGLVVNIDEDWSQRVSDKNVDIDGYDLETNFIWMSFAIFNPSGIRVTEWSIPVNLKGEKGDQGIPGPQGPVGTQGEKGDRGDSSNSYRTISVYTTTEDTIAPSKPIGGRWDLDTNTITPPSTTNDRYKWYLNADDVPENNYLWMSQATFGETGGLINDWCRPFRLTGIPGKDGEKGPQGDPGKDGVVDQTSLDRIEANLANAFYTKEEIDNLEQTLNDLISNNGSEQAIADAKAALDKATAVNEEIQSLKDKFNDDGTIKYSVLNETDIYNLSKASLGTDISENGVFAQQIVGLIATFGSVKADNITGDSISGKTVQSADADGNLGEAWKLESTGAGHIANGQISWNADGSEVNLGSNVKLTWGDNIDGKPSIPTEEEIDDKIGNAIDNLPKGISEERVTEITRNTIETEELTATNLHVNAANINGKLTADKIDVNSLAVQRLNTTPGETKAGTIKIEGNELTVRDSNVDTEILLVTGSSDISVPTLYSMSRNFGGSSNTVTISNGTKMYSFEEYNIIAESTFKRNIGAEYKLESSIPNTEFKASIIDPRTKNILSESLDGVLACGIVFSDAILDETWVREHYTKMNSIPISTENSSKIERVYCYLVNDKSEPKNLSSINELDPNVTYNIYTVTGYMLIGNITNNTDSLINVYTTISSPNANVVITPSMRKTIIAGDGLYYIVSHDTYFVMNDSKFEVSIKGKKITLTENGFVG